MHLGVYVAWTNEENTLFGIPTFKKILNYPFESLALNVPWVHSSVILS